jgi:ribonuclease HI
MDSIPPEERSKEAQGKDFSHDPLPVERALGMKWNVEEDMLGYQVRSVSPPFTRRSILSVVSSIYDPLGLISPFVLVGKLLLQELCQKPDIGWDDPVPSSIEDKWKQWCLDLSDLALIKVPRCFKPQDFGNSVRIELVVFSDASFTGYGSLVYLRQQNSDGMISTSLIVAKSRVAPLKATTVPRLELTAAVTALKLAVAVRNELELANVCVANVTFFTDSTAVLAYIRSDQQRWPIFVANRISLIRQFSSTSQWRYVSSGENPADLASRGAKPDEMDAKWWHGPDFLNEDSASWPMDPAACCVVSAVSSDEVTCNPTSDLMMYWSSWRKLKTCVAVFMKVKKILFDRMQVTRQLKDAVGDDYCLSAQDFARAEIDIIVFIQENSFQDEIHLLSSGEMVKKSSSLVSLDPKMEDGLL